jgi:hypothetical protein
MAGDLITMILSSTCNVQFRTPSYWYVYRGTILRKLKPFSLMPPKKKSRKILAGSQHFLEVFVEVRVRVKFRRNKVRIFCCLLYYYRQQTATVLYTTGPLVSGCCPTREE